MGNLKAKADADRPEYADFDAPAKFRAIQSIVGARLKEHPNAICSYSGGSDSDIMIDIIETARKLFSLPPVKYVFFNTGLEMKATKDHVKETAEKYGVEIEEVRPEKNIVLSTREHGIPFMTKIVSYKLEVAQKKNVSFSIADEYENAENKVEKLEELKRRYPGAAAAILWICGCDKTGASGTNTQYMLRGKKYLKEFLTEYPPDFQISAKCCDDCKKKPAHKAEKGYDMIITGERKAEGGERAGGPVPQTCFSEQRNGQFRLKPLFWVSDTDKAWYKAEHNIRYSDAYEVYGLRRTGCCGCPINYKATEELEKIRPYEPNVVKAAWNIFGDSYRYRQAYNEYKAKKYAEAKNEGQMPLFDAQSEDTK